MLAACVTLAGQTFEKAKMYVEQEHKLKLHKVAIITCRMKLSSSPARAGSTLPCVR